MARTRVAKLSSERTRSAASRATSAPVRPMATPIAAASSAGASLTPSPVTATISPAPAAARTMRSLSSGLARATMQPSETHLASSWSVQTLAWAAIRTGPDRPSNGVGSGRLVPGDHRHPHSGALQLSNGARDLWAQRVVEGHQTLECQLFLQPGGAARGRLDQGAGGDRQHPGAPRRQLPGRGQHATLLL